MLGEAPINRSTADQTKTLAGAGLPHPSSSGIPIVATGPWGCLCVMMPMRCNLSHYALQVDYLCLPFFDKWVASPETDQKGGPSLELHIVKIRCER